jgi:hypothetical protein
MLAILILLCVALTLSTSLCNQFLFEITKEHDRAQDHLVLFGTNWNRVYNLCILNAQTILAYLHALKLIQGLSTSMQCTNNS